MKLKDARKLIRKIVRLEFMVGDKDFIDSIVQGEYDQYKRLHRSEREAYDIRMKQNFDILSSNAYTSSVTSS